MQAELHEMLRPAFEVGARVEQHGRAGARGNGHGQRRALDAGSTPNAAWAARKRGAGVPGAEQRLRLAARDQIGRDPHRRARLAPQRRQRRFVHRDGVGRLDNGDADGIGRAARLRELVAHDGRGADQRDGETGTRGRLNARRRRPRQAPGRRPSRQRRLMWDH